MQNEKEFWIHELGLLPHPEGGYYKEIYRSEDEIPVRLNGYEGARNFSTSIYFLLDQHSKSHLHILSSDELWYWHAGGSGLVHLLSENGERSSLSIGKNPHKGEALQILIPRKNWFAAEVTDGDFLLVSCVVAPGFDFRDFILGSKKELSERFPQHSEFIDRFSLL